MSCERYVEWIAARLAGSLAEDRAKELEKHMAECSRCRAELLLQKRIQTSLVKAESSGLTAGFTERIVDEVRRRERRERRLTGFTNLLPAAALAAGVVLAFVFRFQIDRYVPPAVEGFVNRIAAPLTAFGDGVISLLGKLSATPLETGWSGWAPSVMTNTLVPSAVALAAVFWALLRVRSYLST
jgi:hypothetical protein